MKSIQKTKAPGWFTALSIIALLWNLMGVMAYLAQVYMTDEILAALTQEQQDVINNAPYGQTLLLHWPFGVDYWEPSL